MYKAVVARKVRATFERLSQGDHEAMVATLAPTFSYRFAGEGALSGHRNSAETMRRWWARVDELLPGARFTVRSIVVSGHPLNTRVATHVEIEATLADGEVYRNEFMQFLRLRLGRITDVVTLEDTARLGRLLSRLADRGVAAASAEPLVGAPRAAARAAGGSGSAGA